MALELFAGLPVGDYARAVEWYERLLGTPATFHAHDTECVWTLAAHRSIYVVLDPAHAGHALVTFFPEDLDRFVGSAAARGIHPDRTETYDNAVRKVTFRDPDGNEIGVGGLPADTSQAS